MRYVERPIFCPFFRTRGGTQKMACKPPIYHAIFWQLSTNMPRLEGIET
ncbi:hypothetical protein LZ24_02660, partial [Desulfobotulus alkaliphilus]